MAARRPALACGRRRAGASARATARRPTARRPTLRTRWSTCGASSERRGLWRRRGEAALREEGGRDTAGRTAACRWASAPLVVRQWPRRGADAGRDGGGDPFARCSASAKQGAAERRAGRPACGARIPPSSRVEKRRRSRSTPTKSQEPTTYLSSSSAPAAFTTQLGACPPGGVAFVAGWWGAAIVRLARCPWTTARAGETGGRRQRMQLRARARAFWRVAVLVLPAGRPFRGGPALAGLA